jgi:hypothetical protein
MRRGLDRPASLDRCRYKWRSESATVEIARLRRQLGRPRRHYHASNEIADAKPLGRVETQPPKMHPLASRFGLDVGDLRQELWTGLAEQLEAIRADLGLHRTSVSPHITDASPTGEGAPSDRRRLQDAAAARSVGPRFLGGGFGSDRLGLEHACKIELARSPIHA